MGLNGDKTSNVFFVLIFVVFLPDFLFFVPQWHYHSSFIKIVNFSDLYTPQNQNVHCAVSSNDQYRGNGFAADVLLGRDHPRVVTIASIVRGVIAFSISGT